MQGKRGAGTQRRSKNDLRDMMSRRSGLFQLSSFRVYFLHIPLSRPSTLPAHGEPPPRPRAAPSFAQIPYSDMQVRHHYHQTIHLLSCLCIATLILTSTLSSSSLFARADTLDAGVKLLATSPPYVPTPRAFGVSVIIENTVWYYGGAARNSLTSLVTDTADLFALPLNFNFTTASPPFVSHDSDATLFGSLAPPESSWQAACIGFDGNSFLVLGGYMEPNTTLLYSYSTVTHLWAKPLIVATAPPPPRYREWTIVLNSTVNARAFVFGGSTVVGLNPTWTNDLWTLNSSGVWANLTALGADQGTRLWPLSTVDHTAHMLANGRMVVVGGRTVDGKMGDLGNMWVFNTKAGTWERQKAGGSLPVNRAHHTSVMSGTSTWNATVFLNDVAVLDTSTWQWSIPTIIGTPPSVRWGHNANYALGQMVIAFGENPISGQDNSIYILDATTWAWTTNFSAIHGLPSFPHATTTVAVGGINTAVANVSQSIPHADSVPTGAIIGSIIGGVLIMVGVVGGILLHRQRRQKPDTESDQSGEPPAIVNPEPGPPAHRQSVDSNNFSVGYSPMLLPRIRSSMDRPSMDSNRNSVGYGPIMATRMRHSWTVPGHSSPLHTAPISAPSPTLSYADWATDVYRASLRASRRYREGSLESTAPILERAEGKQREKVPQDEPRQDGPSDERAIIEQDVEELYKDMEIQTIAVPKQVLYVVNRD
ncbi:hypothetical protein BC937DRAFT_92339 [Endogone sp. FLAS-F59071]|nr:hypothetical protein BC937DRAFT_92339 [Endogone sp. FLAS-F59071]|eukprot:RUS15535.1 hypothetical protein BC937DRAFT_92339 [Endogone sp. FLAS-F59071]